jgi:hypothetical protein
VGQATRAIAHRKPTDAQDIMDQAQDASHRDTGVDVGIEACPPFSLPTVNILPNIDMRAIGALITPGTVTGPVDVSPLPVLSAATVCARV